MGENRNLLVAFLLSAIVIFGWEYFVAMPQMKDQQHKQAALTHQEKKNPELGTVAAPSGAIGVKQRVRCSAFQKRIDRTGDDEIAIEVQTRVRIRQEVRQKQSSVRSVIAPE